MYDFSTQSIRNNIKRDELEFDILFVGAGPSNLASLWHLINLLNNHNTQTNDQRTRNITIGLIEKGNNIGDHTFSGAVLDPIAIKELCPDYIGKKFPIEGYVTQEEIWLLHKRGGIKLPVAPPFMHNIGYPIISMTKMVQWMANEIEKINTKDFDVMLLPGFAGIKILWEGNKVIGIQTADKGVNTDGTPKSNFEPGTCIKAKITVFGEGPRGHLYRELNSVLGLQNNATNPELYETGVKEIWEIPENNIPNGFVFHSTGWPQENNESGGSFIYKMANNRVAIGYVASLDTKDPFFDTHLILQQFKTHSRIKPILNGGKLVEYGAKAMAIGGWYSIPTLTLSGGIIVGDAAQLVNSARFKGIHLGMKSGMCAAETIIEAIIHNNFHKDFLNQYSKKLMASWVGKELRNTRNFHQIMKHGINPISALQLGISLVTKGWIPQDPILCIDDAKQTLTTEGYYGKHLINREAIGQNNQFDNELYISKLDAIYTSGVMHDEHQPSHLKIIKGDDICAKCWLTKGSPCTYFCPAQVYEAHPNSDGLIDKINISYSNCLHCKTCDIKCPEQNILWTPPEGGGGPNYTIC